MLVSRRSLNINDQIALLKGATFEILQIRFNMVFNAENAMWEFAPFSYCVDDAVRGKLSEMLGQSCLYQIRIAG